MENLNTLKAEEERMESLIAFYERQTNLTFKDNMNLRDYYRKLLGIQFKIEELKRKVR